MRVRSRDGEWVIDVVRLSLTGTGRDGEWLRVSRWGCFVTELRSVSELARLVDLATLEEALTRITTIRGRGRSLQSERLSPV